MSQSILAEILSDEILAEKVEKAKALTAPEPSAQTKKNWHWIQPCIWNLTQFPIELSPPIYNWSGKILDQPKLVIEPFSVGVYSSTNTAWNFSAGATGGSAHSLMMKPPGTSFDFAIGWTCPLAGGYKSGAVESTNPNDGYNKTTNGGNAIISSTQYTGMDADANDCSIRFKIVTLSGQRPQYTITQYRV